MHNDPLLVDAQAPTDQATMRRADTGTTLTEILISIALLGTIVIALVTAVQTMMTTSSTVFEVAQVETVLLNAGDQVERATQQCDYDVFVESAAIAEGWPSDAVTVTVELLVSNTGDPAADWAPQDCSVALEPFDVQRLVIRASHPTQAISRTLMVVKSDVGN